MRLKSLTLATALGLSATGLQAQTAQEQAETIRQLIKRIEELEQKVKIADRKYELDKEDAAAKAKTAATVSVSANGFTIQSADKDFLIKFRGLAQVDSRNYVDGSHVPNDDSFVLRRARLGFDATFRQDFDLQLLTEFGGTGAPSILDANVTYRYRAGLQLKVGKFKQPIGLEVLQMDAVRFFNESGLPTNLVPNRDLGVQLQGELGEGFFSYQAGIFNGLGDGRSTTNADLEDDKDVVGRIFFHPFALGGPEVLKGLGLGVSASYGNRANTSSLTTGYVTDGQRTFFTYNAAAVANGDAFRWSPQAYYYYGPFGFLAEYVNSSQRVTLPGVRTDVLDNNAWSVTGSYVLTGENASYRGVTPARDFSLANGTWGAFQVVARIGQLDVDNDAFNLGYANPNASASQAWSWGLGLNWYLNKNMRASLSYSQTSFDVNPTAAITNPVIAQDEQFISTRVQLTF